MNVKNNNILIICISIILYSIIMLGFDYTDSVVYLNGFKLLINSKNPYCNSFYYTPLFLLFYYPIYINPIINMGFILFCYTEIFRDCNKIFGEKTTNWIIFTIGFYVVHDIYLGNVHTLITMLILKAWKLKDERLNMVSGFILGFICFKPNMIIIFGLILLTGKKNKELILGFSIGILLNYIPLVIIINPLDYIEYIRNSDSLTSYNWYVTYRMQLFITFLLIINKKIKNRINRKKLFRFCFYIVFFLQFLEILQVL